MLTFHQYKKFYNNELIVEVENLSLDPNVYWILGENGSGKSTLLKCAAGLVPYKGNISCDDIFNNNKNRQSYRRIVNYAEAEPQYPEFLKGMDLIHFYKKAKGAPTEQISRLLSLLDIESFASRKIGEYSSGMVKRLSLVLAFIGNPRLILLDEPLITLDKDAAGTILELIKEYALNGVSTILTSHQEFNGNTGINFKKLLLINHQLESIA
jgi:ABC-2 type transport system ATP-binding protein